MVLADHVLIQIRLDLAGRRNLAARPGTVLTRRRSCRKMFWHRSVHCPQMYVSLGPSTIGPVTARLAAKRTRGDLAATEVATITAGAGLPEPGGVVSPSDFGLAMDSSQGPTGQGRAWSQTKPCQSIGVRRDCPYEWLGQHVAINHIFRPRTPSCRLMTLAGPALGVPNPPTAFVWAEAPRRDYGANRCKMFIEDNNE